MLCMLCMCVVSIVIVERKGKGRPEAKETDRQTDKSVLLNER